MMDALAESQVRPQFVARMEEELRRNARKGNWADWKPSMRQAMHELRWHCFKLENALDDTNCAAVAEHSADVANIVMKIDELYGE